SNATGECPTCGDEICSDGGYVCNRCGKRPDKPLLSYPPFQHVPTEEAMRTQMFKTMVALERMADAVTDHLTADKQPPEQNENSTTRCPEQKKTTEPCWSPTPPYDQAQTERSDLCVNCAYPLGDHRRAKIIKGDLIVNGDLTVKGCTTTIGSQVVPGPMAPLDSDLREIREILGKHRKAIALVATFGQFKDVGFFGTKPERALQRLVRLKSCSCVGTGWVARDESCKECKQQGYIET
ncbi:hypothetical protein LCGC14_3095050, partial [marine sediment metagenome]